MYIQFGFFAILTVAVLFYVLAAKESDPNLKSWKAIAVVLGFGFLAYLAVPKKPTEQMTFNERMNDKFGPFYTIFFWITALTAFGFYDIRELFKNFGVGDIFQVEPGELISNKLTTLVVGVVVLVLVATLVMNLFNDNKKVNMGNVLALLGVLGAVLLVQNWEKATEWVSSSLPDLSPYQGVQDYPDPDWKGGKVGVPPVPTVSCEDVLRFAKPTTVAGGVLITARLPDRSVCVQSLGKTTHYEYLVEKYHAFDKIPERELWYSQEEGFYRIVWLAKDGETHMSKDP